MVEASLANRLNCTISNGSIGAATAEAEAGGCAGCDEEEEGDEEDEEEEEEEEEEEDEEEEEEEGDGWIDILFPSTDKSWPEALTARESTGAFAAPFVVAEGGLTGTMVSRSDRSLSSSLLLLLTSPEPFG